jgi:hypothetical protein
MQKKFSEQSTGTQWGTIATIIALLFGGFGAAIWAAGDNVIDQKYATDDDLRSVQEQFVQQFNAALATVEQNTATLKSTAASVDGLTLVVLDLRIRDLEGIKFDLESEKTNAGANWNSGDERELVGLRKSLSDLNTQRDRLFERVLSGQ